MLEYFLRKSVVTICLNLAILILGIFAFPRIAREFIPAIDIPAVAVVYPTTVHSLDTVRKELLEPAEQKLLQTGVIDRIESFYENGHAVLLLFFDWSLKPEECIQRARQTLSSFKPPAGMLNPLFILHRPTMSPIFRMGFFGDNPTKISKNLKVLSQDLERIPGVAQIRILGSSEKKTVLSYRLEDLAKYQIQPKTLLQEIVQKWGFRALLVDSVGTNNISVNIQNADQLLDLGIPNTQKQFIPIRFFTTKISQSPPAEVLNQNGQPTMILEVIKAPGADAVSLTEQIQKRIQEFSEQNKDTQSTIIYNEAEKIVDSQAGVYSNFLSGIVLNSIVLMIFLGSFAGVVVASSIFPTTILGSLFILKQAGISLNIFSLNGFSLAAGMITDASTVVLETIMRRVQGGEDIESASLKGTKEIFVGVISGTLSSAAVMLPICLQSGVSSKLFSDLGYTLVITQLLSLVTVFTFVPWLCFKMIKKDAKQPRPIEILFSGSSFVVRKFISFALGTFRRALQNKIFRISFPSTIAILCVSSLLFLPSSELLPVVKANTYAITIPMKRARIAAEKDQLVRELTQLIGPNSSVEWAITNADSDSLIATLKARHDFDLDSLIKTIATQFKISPAQVLSFPLGPTPPTEPMNFHGYYYFNKNIPENIRSEIKSEFCKMKGISVCDGSEHYSGSSERLHSETISMTREKTNPIEAALQAASQLNSLDINSIANLNLPEPVELITRGELPLTESAFLLPQITKFVTSLDHLYQKSFSYEELTRFRVDSVDYEPVYFKLDGVTLGVAIEKMESLKKKYNLGDTDLRGMGGIQNMQETFSKMTVALLISLALTILILMLQFKSAVQTSIIMLSIPLSVGGAVMGLLLLRETVNISVMVGFILLGGIIVNNGILLMEAINQGIEGGLSLVESIETAVTNRTRPILMTSVSAIAGMLPTLLFESEGQELYRGMAIVNIFGMAFGTVLTLVVVPVICWIFLRSQHEKS